MFNVGDKMEKDIRIDRYGCKYYITDGIVYKVNDYGESKVYDRELFFDRDGELFIGSGNGVCGRGAYAVVYMCDDDEHCFKVFDSPDSTNIDPYVLDVMMNEDLPGFYDILDTFYKKDGDNVYLAGYIMNFLKRADMVTFRQGGVDLLSKDSSYIIESYERLTNSIMTLSKRGVLLDDTAEYNTSVEDDGLVIYDVDSFKRSNEPVEEIYLKNMKKLNGLMVTMISRDMMSHHSHEVKVEPFSSYFEEVRESDSKVDFGDVFKPGLKGIDSLVSYSQRKSK